MVRPELFNAWLVGSVAVVFCYCAWCILREALIYSTRQDLYEIRDRVFREYVKRGWNLQSPAHLRFRTHVHLMIQAAHVFGPLVIVSVARLVPKSDTVSVMLELHRLAESADERRFLEAGSREVTTALAVGLMKRSIVLWPLLHVRRVLPAETKTIMVRSKQTVVRARRVIEIEEPRVGQLWGAPC